jgi:hypothetical protein
MPRMQSKKQYRNTGSPKDAFYVLSVLLTLPASLYNDLVNKANLVHSFS